MDRLAPLFLRQGFVASSTEEPFDDYLVQGMGKSPMVMIYESQFIAARGRRRTAASRSDMVLMYPDPTIFSKHTFVGLTPERHPPRRLPDQRPGDPHPGHRVRLPHERHAGLRDLRHRATSWRPSRHRFVDVIDPPTYEALEAMITRLEADYAGAGLPTASPDRPDLAAPRREAPQPSRSTTMTDPSFRAAGRAPAARRPAADARRRRPPRSTSTTSLVLEAPAPVARGRAGPGRRRRADQRRRPGQARRHGQRATSTRSPRSTRTARRSRTRSRTSASSATTTSRPRRPCPTGSSTSRWRRCSTAA